MVLTILAFSAPRLVAVVVAVLGIAGLARLLVLR